MNRLIRKELREHVAVTLLGLLILSGLLIQSYQHCAQELSQVLFSRATWLSDSLQPLLFHSLLNEAAYFCAIFGALLGWFQMRTEKHPDLWAFLVHRPVTRTSLFLAKVLAGLTLYSLAVGLPMLGLIVAVRIPGHIAAPFEWAMTLPLLALFLAGTVCYFAGMLTGLRQARWYASRGLGLGAGILVMIMVAVCREFWEALVWIIIGGAILATAAWGSFQSGGYYEGQPRVGKSALTVTLLGGSLVLVGALYLLGSVLILDRFTHSSSAFAYYCMTRDGTIHKVSGSGDGQEKIVNMDGKALLDPKTGRPITPRQFAKRVARSWSITVKSAMPDWYYYDTYRQSRRFFSLWRLADRTLWYFTRNGRLMGYSGVNRRLIPSLRPPESSIGATESRQRFLLPQDYAVEPKSPPPSTLATSTTLYEVKLSPAELKPVFTTAKSDPILATVEVQTNRTLVLTRHYLQLVNGNGTLEWRMPFKPGLPRYNQATLYSLDDHGRYAVWLAPSPLANAKSREKLPTHVIWISKGAGVETHRKGRSIVLPPIHPAPRASTPESGVGFVVNLITVPIVLILASGESLNGQNWLFLVSALIYAAVGWSLCWRYRLSSRARIGWGMFHLLCGLPGLLAFLSVQEWPARERCPGCGRFRAVNRSHCEYCGEDFPPPALNGTEIFAPLTGN